MKRSHLLLGVAVVVLAAVAWWLFAHRGSAPAASNEAPPVAVATVRQGYVEERLGLVGRAGPAAGAQNKLAFGIAGTLGSIDVRIGERVDAGTPLAHLDAQPYALAASEAGADARAASANAALAAVDRTSVRLAVDRAELARKQHLYGAGIVALRDVQAAQAAVAADGADSSGARDQLAAANAAASAASAHAGAAGYDLERTTLRAPSSGLVTAIFAQSGESVDATTPVIAFSAGGRDDATLDVAAGDVPKVHPGQLVHVRAGNATFDARIAGVGTAVDPATGLALLQIAGVPSSVGAGTPLDASVVVANVQGLVVPAGAVISDPQSGDALVFVQTKNADGSTAFVSRKVTVGGTDTSFARITSGLRAGERVAAQGAIDLLAPAGGTNP